jgi:hypothetical protein
MRDATADNLDRDVVRAAGREEFVGFAIDFHKKAVVLTPSV